MAEQRRPGRDGAPKREGRPAREGSRGTSSSREGGRGSRTGNSRDAGRSGGRDSGRDAGKRDFSRPRRDDKRVDRRDRDEVRSEDQARYDGPELPEEITGKEIDRGVASQLKSLPEKLAIRVARHLVAAGQLLESDPKTAYGHTLAARARAGRLAVVREAVGEAAYAAGEYSEALAELRAAKRMNGSWEYLAVMADCERALKKPDKALALIKNANREKMGPDLLAELVIVEAGARRDRGELEAALRALENAPINNKSRAPWVARLRYVYADTLVEAGRPQDAIEWFHRTEAIDVDGVTDAAERAAALEASTAE